MIRRSFLILSLVATLLSSQSPAEAGFCTSFKKCKKEAGKVLHDTGKTVGQGTRDAGKAVEKAAQDAGKTSEKAAQDAGKTSEKAGRDTWNELTRDRKDGENIQMDFSNVTSGPVEGGHYSLVHENGSGVVVFLRPCVLTVVDSKDGKVTSMLPITGRAGDRLMLKVNQGIRTEW